MRDRSTSSQKEFDWLNAQAVDRGAGARAARPFNLLIHPSIGSSPKAVDAMALRRSGGRRGIAAASASSASSSDTNNISVRRRADRILILPGFASSSEPYRPMKRSLQKRFPFSYVEVLPVRANEWVASTFGGSFDFYINRLDDAVRRLHDAEPRGQKVALVGHSAGGWLARIFLSDRAQYCGRAPYAGHQYVETLVTLGTPHLSIEKYPFGRVPERRRGEEGVAMSSASRGSSLCFANEFCRADDPALGDCRIVSVAGRAVHGASAGWSTRASYEATCGAAEVDGDGVTPLASAFAPGSDEEVTLEGVHHSPKGDRVWYGSQEAVDAWCAHLR